MTFFANVTWLGEYLRRIPSISGQITAHFNSRCERTRQRVKEGSSTRDLFYYLVRPPSPSTAERSD